MFRLKVAKDGNTLQYIPLIRKCFPALSIGEIRRRIGAGEPVAEQEAVPRWDPVDEERGVDRLQAFCTLVHALSERGAQVTILDDGGPLTGEQFRNRLAQLEEIRRQVEADMEREADE